MKSRRGWEALARHERRAEVHGLRLLLGMHRLRGAWYCRTRSAVSWNAPWRLAELVKRADREVELCETTDQRRTVHEPAFGTALIAVD